MAKTTGQYSSFPSQAVSDSEKRSDDYGLQVAKAIEQDWFNRRRERYFRDDRGIDSASLHVKKWLKIKQFWKSKQFHNGAPMALLPSAAGLKAVRNEDSQKVQETSIDGVNWFKKNVKDNLVLLKRRKRGKKQV